MAFDSLVNLVANLAVKTTADPAANAEFTFTVPTGKIWEPVSLSVQLVQGATQTPWPYLVIDDGANIIAQQHGGSAALGVSSTAQYTWARIALGGTAAVGATPNINVVSAIPEVVLPAGYRIRSNTIGIGANTNYGVPRLLVVEYDAR
jgi:hypothetical protein